MKWAPGIAAGAIVAAVACARDAGQRSGAPDSALATAAGPADSLAARGPGGVEIWFTLAREDHAPDGHSCVARTLEIRRNGTRIPVPLLYTGEAPRIVNDTTLEATIYRACAPSDRYRVDLRTGQPTPVRHAA